MKNSIRLFSIILIMCISLVTNAQEKRGYVVEVGEKAPNFEIVTPNGKKVMLSDLKGKVVMLQFTATWCGVCLKEMPHIESDIWAKLKQNKDFALYGVMYKQGAKDIERMIELTSVTYPLAIDIDGEIFHKFADKGAGVTRNVIVDKEGNIAFLTRLYDKEEFGKMVKKINELIVD